jgi:hypothetical protein
LSDPHLILAGAAALIVAAEYGYQKATSDGWLMVQAASALAALLVAWSGRERLRLLPVLAVVLGLHAAVVGVHLGLGLPGDPDSRAGGVFDREGRELLDGTYPRSEYPVGAVLLFAAERGLSGGHTRVANAVLMILFQLLAVVAIWATRTRLAPWLATVVAFWPMTMFYWEYRFDLVPAALLVSGLALAWRERWAAAGALLGAGALVKWTPALAVAVLVVWLAASGFRRELVRHASAFALVVVLVYVPFLVWSPDDVLAAYSRQATRSITAESLWYLPLHAAGLAHVRSHISFSAGAPGWADAAAVALQAALVGAALVGAWLLRGNRRGAVAVAALAPVGFLLTNRIFSPQFLLVILAAWALAAALVARSAREQLAVGLAAMAASFANAFVYPFALPWYRVTWEVCSAVLFATALAVTGWLAARAVRQRSGLERRR